MRSELQSIHSRGLLNLAIEELGIYGEELEPHQVEPFITGLFDVADLLSDEKRGMSEVPAHWRVGFLVNKSVEKLSDDTARLGVLTGAITKTDGLFMAVDFVGPRGRATRGQC